MEQPPFWSIFHPFYVSEWKWMNYKSFNTIRMKTRQWQILLRYNRCNNMTFLWKTREKFFMYFWKEWKKRRKSTKEWKTFINLAPFLFYSHFFLINTHTHKSAFYTQKYQSCFFFQIQTTRNVNIAWGKNTSYYRCAANSMKRNIRKSIPFTQQLFMVCNLSIQHNDVGFHFPFILGLNWKIHF